MSGGHPRNRLIKVNTTIMWENVGNIGTERKGYELFLLDNIRTHGSEKADKLNEEKAPTILWRYSR